MELFGIFLAAGTVFWVSAYQITSKAIFGTNADGLGGDQLLGAIELSTCATALGMLLVGVVRWLWLAVGYLRGCCPVPMQANHDPVQKLEDGGLRGALMQEFRGFLAAGVPAFFRMSNVVLLRVAVPYLPLATLQGVNSASVLFTAMLSQLVLGEPVGCYRWFSVVLCVLGIVLFCVSSFLNSSASPTDVPVHLQVMAYIFASLAALSNALVNTAKAKLMKGSNMGSAELAGSMGIWMMILLPCLAWPAFSEGEDGTLGWWDKINGIKEQAQSNGMIPWFIAANIISTAAAGQFGNMVIVVFSGTVYTILSGPVTIAALWLMDMGTSYVGCVTCPWASRWMTYSWIQVIGFLIITAGTLGYSGVLLPHTSSSPQKSDEQESNTTEESA